MKITARINHEDQKLLQALLMRGVNAKMVRKGIIVELPASAPFTYWVLKEVGKAKLFIDVTEQGGGMTHTGDAVVVCGMSGKALRPYFIPRGGHLACGEHAFFAVPNTCVTVTGYRRDATIVIAEHRVVREDQIARITSKQLWVGEANEAEWKCPECHRVVFDDVMEGHTRADGEPCFGTPTHARLTLPNSFERFQSAAMAARAKADCYHCRHVHYAAAMSE